MKKQKKNAEGRPIIKYVTFKETAFEKNCRKEIELLKQELEDMRKMYLEEMELAQKFRELYKVKEAESHKLNIITDIQGEDWYEMGNTIECQEEQLKQEKKIRRMLERHLNKSEEGRAILAEYKAEEKKRIPIYVEAEADENIF